MNKLMPLSLVVVLAACGQSETSQTVTGRGASIPTVEELASNPEQLKELRQQCKTDRPQLGDVLCNRVAEATRQRFHRRSKNPYES